MERKIKLADLKSAVMDAYEKYKPASYGEPDPRVAGMNAGKFGISVCLASGTRFDVGDTQAPFAMGTMLRIPVFLQLLTQMPVEEIVKKMRLGKCPCSCDGTDPKPVKPKGVHAKNLREVSLVQPIGDADGKMEILSNLMISLMGSSPVLDDGLYKAAMKANEDKNVVNTLAADGYELYDDTNVALQVATKLDSMLVTTGQLAEMGATIAADGVNPVSKVPVFDGSLSASILGMMAAKGPKKIKKPWLVITGLPAMSSFGGGLLAVMPGLGAFAAFSPELVDGHVPFKAVHAIKYIATTLGLNAFASARVKVEE